MRTRISRRAHDAILRESAAAGTREACGLLFGSQGVVDDCQATENTAENPERHFEIDPRALFSALRAERAGGPAIAGYWHSHPSGDATPSATDAAMAAPDGKLWVIAAGGALRGWRAVAAGAVHGRFDPVALDVES